MEDDLHPFLGSLGQYLLTKIKFSKFSNYKRHLLRFISMSLKKKFFLFQFVTLQCLRFDKPQNHIGIHFVMSKNQ
jgi:hypothetical protein